MALPYSNRFVVIFFALLALSTVDVSFGAPVERKLAASLKNKDIPWKDLIRRLSKKAKLIKASKKAFAKQCDAGFDKPEAERPGDIFDRKSGLCLDSFSCAFKDCLPGANHTLSVNANKHALHTSDIDDVQNWKDPSNPDYALPASVLFPNTAGDIVAAVEFANKNNLELSIKSSGHNYGGQSSKKDTLLLNSKRFQKYAPTGIVECDADGSSEIQSDLSNQPCVLARARNKEAYIRVATGETFGELYQSIHDFNEAQEEYKYLAVGGATVTVTPMGWTFQGGMASTASGRLYGYGVDQVLSIEAVLPTGEFVRFGPTDFEPAAGYHVPKTTAVSGVCNQNPFDDEESWVWGPCAKDINFEDLWYAFRGGGGGTYGIATSLFLQLHPYAPLELVPKDAAVFGEGFCNVPDFSNGIDDVYIQFLLDFVLEPEKVGVTKEESSACGAPFGNPVFYCYGEGSSSKFISAWKKALDKSRNDLLAKGIPESSIEQAEVCLDDRTNAFKDLIALKKTITSELKPTPFPLSRNFDPSWSDIPPDQFWLQPAYLVGFDSYTMSEETRSNWFAQYKFFTSIPFYHVVGGVGSKYADDQMTSLPSTFRNAAFYTMVPLLDFDFNLFPLSPTAIQNGYFVQNHQDPFSYGPLKSDVTTQCPLDKLTFAEADEQCHSYQEAVWGLERLARLEKIKATVDPNHILNCYKCVGYKKDSIAEYKPSKKKPKKSNKSRRAIV